MDKVFFGKYDVTQIIRKWNSNKSLVWDNVSIRMIKICDKSVSYPLELISQASFQKVIFLDLWENANIVFAHIKEEKSTEHF